MQKITSLIILSLTLVSCYTYQIKKPIEPTNELQEKSKRLSADSGIEQLDDMKTAKIKSLDKKNQQIVAPVPLTIEQKLAPNKNVKIEVDGKSHKVIVDRWEADSLVVHPVRNPKVVMKFHKNQINADKIAEKRFSQPIADIITVTAYVGIGVAIWALLK